MRALKILGLGSLFLPLLLIVQVVIGTVINAAQHKPSSPWRNQVLPNDGACNEGSGDSAAG